MIIEIASRDDVDKMALAQWGEGAEGVLLLGGKEVHAPGFTGDNAVVLGFLVYQLDIYLTRNEG